MVTCDYCGEPTTEAAGHVRRQCQDCGMYLVHAPVWSPAEKVVGGALLLASVGSVFFLWAWMTFG